MVARDLPVQFKALYRLRSIYMVRKSWAAFGAILLLTLSSGCCLCDRPLFQRWRARGTSPDCQPICCPNGGGMQYFGGDCPCSAPLGGVPGGVISGPMMPGAESFPGGSMPPMMPP